MDYTSIHIYGHLLSDELLHDIEQDTGFIGNRDQDFSIDMPTSSAIDYAWSSLRNDWHFYTGHSTVTDSYGTKRSRNLIERLFQSLDYQLVRQQSNIEAGGNSYEINYLCPDLGNLPFIVVGDQVKDERGIETLDRCSLDYRAKGARRRKSPHAMMLEYLNATECVYGIISNGQIIRLLRNSGQLVKLSYVEFDLRKMVEEDKYTEFCLLYRLLHSSRFHRSDDEPCIMERWFNMSIESGNRIRNGLSRAVQRTMETIGQAALTGEGEGNTALREAITDGQVTAGELNKELIHYIYRLLFLFIIEDRNLVYEIPESTDDPEYETTVRNQEIYRKFYAASRLRRLSELPYLRQHRFSDLWEGLMDTFRLFEPEGFGAKLGIKPLGGVLFDTETLHWLKRCRIENDDLLKSFDALNKFADENGAWVKINYSSLDVEEFGSVYEGILEMRPFVRPGQTPRDWQFGFVGGLDRQSTSSYYTRPDLVQSLIRTTLEPVIKERIAKYSTTEEKVRSLLNMKVCDPASGSGHIVLAMARTIAWYVSTLRTGEDNPASLDYRSALREVISRCVYAVDFNPDAVELCKVVLWIEGYCAGKPLSFLDHHIRCGNSVVGISDLDTLLKGVPKSAFKAENDEVKSRIVVLNEAAMAEVKAMEATCGEGGSSSLFAQDFNIRKIDSEQIGLAKQVKEISNLPENTLLEQLDKQNRWEELMETPRVEWLRCACDIYTYSFYKNFTEDDLESQQDDSGNFLPFAVPYTRTVYQALQEIRYLDGEERESPERKIPDVLCEEAERAAIDNRFFHWAVEFPEVFANEGGFDVMCGNPPWDKIKVEDKKWFESYNRPDIVNAGTAAQRKKAIEQLEHTAPELYNEYTKALANAESQSRFVRFSHRFDLTATGDIDLYPMFAELSLSFSIEAWGLVLPTGIAVNDSNKAFFSKLIDDNRLISLFDFENREALFDIHRMFKFCLITAGKPQKAPRTVSGGFYLTRLDHLLDPRRIYTMCTDDFARLNPNTKTCPVFRTSRDAALTAKIYRHSTILLNELTGDNPWNVKFGSMIHMSNDSHIFRTYAQLTEQRATLEGNRFITADGTAYVPLYEGKMIWHYNHHYGTWPTGGERPNSIDTPSDNELQNPDSQITPWYWVPISAVNERLVKRDKDGNVVWEWKHKWIIGFRDVTNATNERTFVCSPIPDAVGVGHSATLLYPECGTMPGVTLLSMMSSIIFDYITKQKIGGSHASISFVKQFPILTPAQISSDMQWQIVKRAAELCYFNHDLDGWAEELWEEMNDEQRTELPQIGRQEPWIYDPDRRALLQAELDAIFAHLYGLSTEDLKYILDPEDVCGKGCINETFRVLRDNEMRQLGEYLTKRLVLEAWERFGYDN
jgi:hypothetical protein